MSACILILLSSTLSFRQTFRQHFLRPSAATWHIDSPSSSASNHSGQNPTGHQLVLYLIDRPQLDFHANLATLSLYNPLFVTAQRCALFSFKNYNILIYVQSILYSINSAYNHCQRLRCPLIHTQHRLELTHFLPISSPQRATSSGLTAQESVAISTSAQLILGTDG